MKFINIRELSTGTSLIPKSCKPSVGWLLRLIWSDFNSLRSLPFPPHLRDCLGTLFRNSLTVGSLKKINNLFIKDIFHGYCLKRQSLTWLRQFGSFANGVPSHDCIARVISRLSVKGFSRMLSELDRGGHWSHWRWDHCGGWQDRKRLRDCLFRQFLWKNTF